MSKVAIYHFTNSDDKRPKVNEKQMQTLREYAKNYGTIVNEYLDKSLKKCEQIQKLKLIDEVGTYDVLVTKDFYHISKNTGACIEFLQQFLSVGIETHSIEDGHFVFSDVPYTKNLNVAIYISKYVDDSPSASCKQKRGNSLTVETQIEIMKLFVENKTNWKITDIYVDAADGQSDDKQVQLLELIQNRNKYNLVLCKDFNSIHWRTAKFCNRRNDLKLDIYSLKEGYLKYGKE